MEAKTYKVILPLVFLVILVLPSILSVININESYPLSERRTLSKFPQFELSKAGYFIDEFETYFNDHFGGRNLIIKAYCILKYFGFKSSPYPDEVEVGKDDWFFLGDNKAKISSEHLGVSLLSPKSIELIKANLIKKKNWLESQGIKYYLFIAPDKHTVYPENLPDYYNKKMINKNTDKLYQALSDDITTIDVRAQLQLQKSKQSEQLYSKTDSHWNDYGAYYAYKHIMRTLSNDFPELGKPKGLNEFTIEEEASKFNTTTDMINISDRILDTDYTFTYKGKQPKLGQLKLPVPTKYDKSKKGYEVRYTYQNGTKLKILLIRDSFSNRLKKFISLHFSESVYINNYHKLNEKIIAIEKPDIVLHEIIERSTQEFLRQF